MPPRRSSRLVFRIGLCVLIIWTLAAIIVSLVLARQHGHPPGMFFVPFVGIGWLIGTVLMIFACFILALMTDDAQ